MSKVPSLNCPDVISTFERAGRKIVRQRGSHIRMQRSSDEGVQKITVPAHKPIKRSTLARILKDARIPLDNFIAHLRSANQQGPTLRRQRWSAATSAARRC